MKRSSYLKYDEFVDLGRKPLKIWAYGLKGKYVCRVEINGAGLALYTGKTGGKIIADLGWEKLVERIKRKK